MIRTRWLAAGLVALVVLVVAGILLLRAERPEGTGTPDGRTAPAPAEQTAAPRERADLPTAETGADSTPSSGRTGAGTIVGVVRDPDGEPVRDAEVTAIASGSRFDPSAFTKPDGTYRIEGLDVGGVYDVVAERDWLAPWFAPSERRRVFLTPDAPVAAVDLRLRLPATIRLRPLGPHGESPDWARAALPGDDDIRSMGTQPPGILHLTDWTPGCHTLEVQAAGCTPRLVEIEFREGESREVTVRLEAGVAISGTVIDDRGEPVPGAIVVGRRAYCPGRGVPSPMSHETVADDRGCFVLDGLARGDLHLRALGWEHESGWAEGLDAPEEDVMLPAPRTGAITCRLALPEGARTPPGLAVLVPRFVDPVLPQNPRGLFSMWEHEFWPARNRLDLERWPAGEWPLGIRVDGIVPVRRKVKVPPGETVDLGTIRLDPGLTLEGLVTDREGKAIAGATVSPGLAREVESDGGGRFVLPHLPPGPVFLKVRADGFVSAYPEPDLGPEMAPVVIRLGRGGCVHGVVVDAAGRPAPGRSICVTTHDEWNEAVSEGPIVTDHRGRFTFRHPTGSYVVTIIENNRFVGRSAEVVLTEGDEVDVRLVDPR